MPLDRRTGVDRRTHAAAVDGLRARRRALVALARSRRASSDGDPAVRDLLLGGATTEALGSNNWVVDGTMTATRQAAARQRSASRRADAVDSGISRTCRRGDFDVIGATLPGAPAVAHRPQPVHRLGRDQRRRRRRGSVSRAPRPDRHDAPSSAARRSRCRSSARRSSSRAAAPVSSTCAITRHGPLISDAINANNAASHATPKPAPLEPLAFRWTALDDEDTTHRRVPEAERGAQLDRVHRGAARLRRAVAELRLRRRRRPHRLLRARAASRFARAATARRRPKDGRATPNGPAGFRSTSCRTPSIRPNTSSSRPTTGRRRPTIRTLIARRVDRAVPRAADRRSAARRSRQADAGRLRAHPGRHAVAPRAGAAAAAARARPPERRPRPAGRRRCCGSGIVDARGDSAAAAIFEAWFLRARAGASSVDELGPPRTAELPGARPLLVRHALPRATRSRRRTARGATTCGRRRQETCDEAVTRGAARRRWRR